MSNYLTLDEISSALESAYKSSKKMSEEMPEAFAVSSKNLFFCSEPQVFKSETPVQTSEPVASEK